MTRRRSSADLLQAAEHINDKAVCEMCVEALEDRGWLLPASSAQVPAPAWTHSRSCDECQEFPVVGPLFRSRWVGEQPLDETTATPRARMLAAHVKPTWRWAGPCGVAGSVAL